MSNDYNKEFYEKEFVSGRTTICRADLEGLPCPFCTEDVSDETMQELADLTEHGTRQRTSDYSDEISEDRTNEIWWEELEDCCVYLNIPYYEDLD